MAIYIVGNPSGSLSVAVLPSRLSGPAPLTVHFDATGTLSTDPTINTTHDVAYSWNFGDAGAGVWAHSGLSKNIQRGGPVTAHCFETPGTYTVKCCGRDINGNVSQVSVTIVVTNPDSAFGGIVAIDPSGGTSWGPPGATYQTTMPSSLGTDNRRYVVRAGSTVGGFTVQRPQQNIQIAQYGTGPKPIIAGAIRIGPDSAPSGSPKTFPTNITMSNLDVRAGCRVPISCDHFTVHKCDFLADSANGETDLRLGANTRDFYGQPSRLNPGWVQNDFVFPRHVFLYESRFIGNPTNVWQAGPYGEMDRGAVMGSEFYGAVSSASCLRLTFAHKVSVMHSNIRGRAGDGSTHGFKLHSSGINPYTPSNFSFTTGYITRYVGLEDNIGGDPTNNLSWLISMRPQSDRDIYIEGLEDIWAYRNRFNPTGGSVDLMAFVRRFTSRANTLTNGSPARHLLQTTIAPYNPANAPFLGPYNGPFTADLIYQDPT